MGLSLRLVEEAETSKGGRGEKRKKLERKIKKLTGEQKKIKKEKYREEEKERVKARARYKKR